MNKIISKLELPAICFIAFIFFQFPNSFAQIHSSIWYFGNKAGLDFRTDPPTPLFNPNLNNQESNATLTDESGNLLFYVTADKIYNKQHQIMDNGDGLLGNGGSSAQGPMIIQDPANTSRYYVFMTADETIPLYKGNLRYSVIDLCENNGLGKVIPILKNILIPGMYSERITAIPFHQGKSFWIITSKLFENTIISFLLDSSGININNPTESSFGNNFSPQVGQIKVNNKKTQLLYSAGLNSAGNGVWMMDYDTLTGLAFNLKQINDGAHAYGIEFSPNDQLVYFTSFFVISGVYQYEIGTQIITTLFENNSNYYVASILIDPKGKLIVSSGIQSNVSAILNPNQAGLQCNYIERYIDLLPNTSGHFSLQNTEYHFGSFDENVDKQFLGRDTIICTHQGVYLRTNDPNTVWSTGQIGQEIFVNSTGTYWARIQLNCNSFSDTIQINAIAAPQFSLPTKITLCEGQSDSLILSIDVNWNDGSYGKKMILYKAGKYWASLNHICGNISDTIEVIVIPKLNPPKALRDSNFCFREPINYSIFIQGARWSDGSIDTIYLKNPGNYSYLFNNGCQQFSDHFQLIKDSLAIPLPEKITACKNENVILYSGDKNSLWSNGQTGSQIQITAPGFYSYSVQNTCGFFNSSTEIEFLEELDESYVPNIFSPNGDNINDEFPGLNYSQSFNLKIFSRWGELIFEGKNNSWNGLFKTLPMPSGVYVYLLQFEDCKAHNTLKGSVTLVR